MIQTPATISHIEYSPSGDITFVRCKPLTQFSFLEGQFMMISSDHSPEHLGKPLKKPYSIATTNHELQEQGTIGFIVKKVRDGYMSDYLTTGIHTGDIIHLQGPLGHMTQKKQHPAYILLSVGSGLSPMVGLYNAIRITQPDAHIEQVFGERYLEYLLPSWQTEMTIEHKTNIHHTLCLSREHERNPSIDITAPKNIVQGYIQDALPDIISRITTQYHRDTVGVYICGKPEMVDSARIILEDAGFLKDNIQFEKY